MHTPAAQAAAIHIGHGSTLAVGVLAITLVVLYVKYWRRHMPRTVEHIVDIGITVLSLGAGVALAASWPGTLARTIFGWIATLWNGNGRTGGTEWATVAAVVLLGIVGAAVAGIAKREHRGPVGAVFVMAMATPLVLVATTGQLGAHVMTALTSVSQPMLTALGTW